MRLELDLIYTSSCNISTSLEYMISPIHISYLPEGLDFVKGEKMIKEGDGLLVTD